jgi:hypothetical protein
VAGDSAVRARRIRQFEHYLGLMEHRTVRLVKSDCFLIFSASMSRAMRSRLGRKMTRIVQFAFLDSGFYLDLPDTTLTPDEAKIMASRPGFGYALNKSHKTPGERQFDPVQRHYPYSEQRAAAEDTAYIFFDLWHTPLDAWIKVHASAFEVARRWERGFSMA